MFVKMVDEDGNNQKRSAQRGADKKRGRADEPAPVADSAAAAAAPAEATAVAAAVVKEDEGEDEGASKKRVRVDEAGAAVAAETEAAAAGAGSSVAASTVVVLPGTLKAHVVVNLVGKTREAILESLLKANIVVSGTVSCH